METHPSKQPRPRHHTLGLKLALAIAVTALALGIAEIILRTTAKPPPPVVFQSLASHMKKVRLHGFMEVIKPDEARFWILAPHQTLPDELPQIRGLIANAASLREDHEIPLRKPPREVRLLFLGDSCTFGFGELHRDSFVEYTERLLQQRYPTVPVECINAGVPGYTIMQGWQHLIRTGLRYQPDLIVASFGWNDARTWAGISDLEHFEEDQRLRPPGPLAHSQLCRRLWRATRRPHRSSSSRKAVPRVSPPDFAELLRRMHLLAAANQAEFMPLLWPTEKNFKGTNGFALTPYQQAIQDFGREEPDFGPTHISDYIDLLPVMDRALHDHDMNELFLDTVHTRALGNACIAEGIVAKIAPWFEATARAHGNAIPPP
jgi:lysophospholipase L1-like esterase